MKLKIIDINIALENIQYKWTITYKIINKV